MLSSFDLVTILFVLTAAFGWVNHRYIRLPHSIGMLAMGLGASLAIVLVDLAVPQQSLNASISAFLRQIDFRDAVMNGMLAFLLFAGALHVDLSILRSRALPVGIMATIGVFASTAVVGVGCWAAASALGVHLPLAWAFVFGALISPTDPVAVLSTLKVVKVPAALETDMSGESLFNDGIGVVVFAVMLSVAMGSEEGASLAGAARLFALEALGGAVLGLATGYVAYRAMRAIDNYPIEVLASLALVMGSYSLAGKLHASGAIAVVVAGLLIGNHGKRDAMSDVTKRYLFSFWTLIDEILNSVLFLLIGLEVLILRFDPSLGWFLAATIPVTLAARSVAVALPVGALSRIVSFVPGTVPILIWGGLRGGISVAMALSLPEVPEKPTILAATYTVVVFTILLQGLTLGPLVRRLSPDADRTAAPEGLIEVANDGAHPVH